MTQANPTVMARHCADAVQVSNQVEIQIMQGLTMTEIYRGPAQAVLELGTSAQTDVLITFVARSAAGLVIEDLQAIHARTDGQRALVLANQTCPDCVIEQLVLGGAVVSKRACHVFGAGDDLQWIQDYVGLVGSALAADVLGKVPADVRLDPNRVVAAWINPAWPWNDDSVVSDMTFLHARFAAQPRLGRRLLADQIGFGEPIFSRQVKTNPRPLIAALAVLALLLYLFAGR